MNKMTTEQAVNLWHQICYEETVAATSESGYPYFTKTTPATAIFGFLGVPKDIGYCNAENGWHKKTRIEIAEFLRQFADSLEGI